MRVLRACSYFDIAGVAEKVRLTCVVGKLPFNDVRVSFEQWPKLKPTSKFGQLPMMEVDGTTVAQSSAMLNYVGKVTGMYPSEPKKALKVDEVIGLHEDLWGAIRPSILVMRDPKLSQKEAQRRQAEMRKELADEKIPAILGFFEKMLAENGTGFFVGSTPTTADIAVYTQLRALQAGYLDGKRSAERARGIAPNARARPRRARARGRMHSEPACAWMPRDLVTAAAPLPPSRLLALAPTFKRHPEDLRRSVPEAQGVLQPDQQPARGGGVVQEEEVSVR